VAVGGVGADDDDDVRVLDRVEVLRAGRGAEGAAQAVAGGEWQTRAQVSVLLLPKTARIIFWTR
jgi:hypothetical protein